MNNVLPLRAGQYYHIFNRGNNGENLFFEEGNYTYFLQLYARHVLPVADNYAYCLMRNHFHLMVRIKTEEEYYLEQTALMEKPQHRPFNPSQNFSNCFNAYSKAINKKYNRSGSLFQDRFKRRVVDSDVYFMNLIFYIHYNPQKHGFVEDFRDWRWSSYHALRSNQSTRLRQNEVLDWFGGLRQYQEFHQGMVDEKVLVGVIDEDLM